MLHSLLLWLAQAENRRYSVNARDLTARRSATLEQRDALMVSTPTHFIKRRERDTEKPPACETLSPPSRCRRCRRSCAAGSGRSRPCRTSPLSSSWRPPGRTAWRPERRFMSSATSCVCCCDRWPPTCTRCRGEWWVPPPPKRSLIKQQVT